MIDAASTAADARKGPTAHRIEALLHELSLARTMPQDAAHDLPDEVPEARQKQPENGPTQLVNDQLTPNKRPIKALFK